MQNTYEKDLDKLSWNLCQRVRISTLKKYFKSEKPIVLLSAELYSSLSDKYRVTSYHVYNEESPWRGNMEDRINIITGELVF